MASDLECDHSMMHDAQEFCPGCYSSRNKIEVLRARAKAVSSDLHKWECAYRGCAEVMFMTRGMPDGWAMCMCDDGSDRPFCPPHVKEHSELVFSALNRARIGASPFRFMINAQARSTVLQLDQGPEHQLFAINGHVLEDARAVQIDKVGDRIRVCFHLETEPKR